LSDQMDVEAAPAIALYRRRSQIVRLAAAKVHVATLYPGPTADRGKDLLPRSISIPPDPIPDDLISLKDTAALRTRQIHHR
jgi:hypothetical protein